jgi:hypothetical protein
MSSNGNFNESAIRAKKKSKHILKNNKWFLLKKSFIIFEYKNNNLNVITVIMDKIFIHVNYIYKLVRGN